MIPNSIAEAWDLALKKRANDLFVAIPALESAQALNYKIDSFFRRAYKIALAFRSELKLKAGDKIALLTESPNDFSLCLHASLLANLTVVPLPLSARDEEIAAVINNLGARVVVFSLEASARIAGLFARLPRIEHWLLAGASSRGGLGAAVSRLDELLPHVSGQVLDLAELAAEGKSSDQSALIVMTASRVGLRGVEFSVRDLLLGANRTISFFDQSAANADNLPRICSFLPMKSLLSIQLGLLVPLLAKYNSFIGEIFDPREFPDFMVSNQIKHTFVDHYQARLLTTRSKARKLPAQVGPSIFIVGNLGLSQKTAAYLELGFGAKIINSYYRTECGGLVTSRVFDGKSIQQGAYTGLVSCGELRGGKVAGLNDITLEIAERGIAVTSAGQIGELVVSGLGQMSKYSGTAAGEAFFSGSNALSTSDRAFMVGEGGGKESLYVLGSASEFVQRGDEEINLYWVENAVYEIKGVQFARVVGFKSASVGTEIGLYLVVNRAANLNENTVSGHLLKYFPWSHIPKVVLFGTSAELSDDEIRGRFVNFSKREFSER